MDLACQIEFVVIETSGLQYSPGKGKRKNKVYPYQGSAEAGVSVTIGHNERQIIPDSRSWVRRKAKRKWPSDSRLMMNVSDPETDLLTIKVLELSHCQSPVVIGERSLYIKEICPKKGVENNFETPLYVSRSNHPVGSIRFAVKPVNFQIFKDKSGNYVLDLDRSVLPPKPTFPPPSPGTRHSSTHQPPAARSSIPPSPPPNLHSATPIPTPVATPSFPAAAPSVSSYDYSSEPLVAPSPSPNFAALIAKEAADKRLGVTPASGDRKSGVRRLPPIPPQGPSFQPTYEAPQPPSTYTPYQPPNYPPSSIGPSHSSYEAASPSYQPSTYPPPSFVTSAGQTSYETPAPAYQPPTYPLSSVGSGSSQTSYEAPSSSYQPPSYIPSSVGTGFSQPCEPSPPYQPPTYPPSYPPETPYPSPSYQLSNSQPSNLLPQHQPTTPHSSAATSSVSPPVGTNPFAPPPSSTAPLPSIHGTNPFVPPPSSPPPPFTQPQTVEAPIATPSPPNPFTTPSVPPPAYLPPQPSTILPSSPSIPSLNRAPTSTTLPTHLTPTALCRYEASDLHRELPHLAAGSYGTVYKGKVPGIEQTVVIKDMNIISEHSVQEWQKEIAVMAQNASDYICRVYGYSSQGNVLTIVMEYMPLGDLFNILHNKSHLHPLSTLQRMRMSRHVALGVAWLHQNGIIHRDIKSMNILVTEDYSCKLTDFGTAKLAAAQQVMMTVNAGTPLWMAPEVRIGQYSFPADIFSLGLVLFEIFHGNLLPYWDQYTMTITLPTNFRSATVVLPCTNRDPLKRPSALQVVQYLDHLIKKVVTAVKESLTESEQRMLAELGRSSNLQKEELEREIEFLYKHLLTKPAQEVDDLINAAFSKR